MRHHHNGLLAFVQRASVHNSFVYQVHKQDHHPQNPKLSGLAPKNSESVSSVRSSSNVVFLLQMRAALPFLLIHEFITLE